MASGGMPFSGSTNGKPILLTGGNDTLHTAGAGTGSSDRWDLAITNSTGAACTVTVYNGAIEASSKIADAVSLPPNGAPLNLFGILNNGLSLIVVASAANVATAWGRIYRGTTGS